MTVKAGQLVMTQTALGVNGYLTSSDPRPHFGLGAARSADSVQIRWPDGAQQTMENVSADRILTVIQGESPHP